jgi:cytochrome c oxidase cbb3-type subunit 3
MYYYHISGTGKGLMAEYEEAQTKAIAAKALQKKNAPQTSGADLNEIVTDEAALSEGKAIYAEKCSSCHGASGEGLVGPNLADKYSIHGNNMPDLVKVITEGVPAKGMIPWGGMLKEKQIQSVAAYIKSLEGTEVANPKKPEGKPIED